MTDLKRRLKYLKADKGISYKQIAEATGISYSKILHFVEGHTQKVSLENELKLKEYLKSMEEPATAI